MIKLAEWYKQFQGLITALLTAAVIGAWAKGCALIDYARDNRGTIERMQKDIESKASKEGLAEHISSSNEQRRQIELDLVDHAERIRYLERK